MTRRLVLAACAWAAVLAQDPTCVDDPAWVKNGDEPWKDCGWVAEFIPTRCAVRGADGRDVLYFLLHAPKNHYELAASFLRKLIVADPKRRKHRARYVALRAVVRIQRGFRARHLRRRTQRRSEMGPLPAIRETSSMRDSSIRSMGDVEGDESRPDLSGDSSGARLSLSAAAERIASSLSGGYQEYKE